MFSDIMEIGERFFAENRDSWREWLKGNHSVKDEIWLEIFKKHTGEKCVSYEEAVEEAVCFGWIDGTLKRIDHRKHVVRFSPRRKGSIWSDSNIARAEKMIREGKMTESGMRSYRERDPDKNPPSITFRGKKVEVPDFIEKGLEESPEAREIFKSLPPSHKNQFIGWITTAKKEETRLRRLKKMISMLKEGRGPGTI